VTGLTTVTGPEIRDKRLQLLKDAVPKARRVAYLGAVPPLQPQTEATARELKLTLLPAGGSSAKRFRESIRCHHTDRVDALFLGDSGFFWGHRHRIIEFARASDFRRCITYRILRNLAG